MNRNVFSDFQAVKEFIKRNFRHFNAAVVADAAEAMLNHLNRTGKLCLP